ncbi:hypothetical protein ROU88_03270 [Macrococcus capreoli]|uniref:hypothetical protein n=1 Tax=Macrococcus capreoli TaxID=2982690 RepID=UPI0021D5F568|nr:hypothetical protein [Macrococcus sp. TMW 2.2395]MCU7558227.1 hypothetical protein [Macrococcus sp. TMW 2.2395]
MFKDMAYYMFGGLDPFFQLFVFEPIVITIIALIVAIVTKKAWYMAIVIILLNLIDSGIDANFAFGAEGIGSVISHTFTFFFANFFSMFYEFVFSFIIAGLPFMHNKFGIA